MITNIAPPGNIAPENLLDNSYFERVINQKGQLSYAGLWNKAFDRWIVSCAEGVAVWVNSNGNANDNIDLPNKVGDQAGQILQVIANKARFLGKQITLAVKTKGGGLRCATGTIAEFAPNGQNASRTHAYFTDSDLWLEVYDVSDDAGLYVRIGNQSDHFIALAWAALYEGIYTSDSLPPYIPRPCSVELAVCQRYYQTFGIGRTAIGITSNRLYIYGTFPTPMRVVPTATVISTASFDGMISGHVIRDATITLGTSRSMHEKGIFYLLLNTDATITSGLVYGCGTDCIGLSAEL